MQAQFVTIEIPLHNMSANAPLSLYESIETALNQWGEPLRWAITEVEETEKMARIEAIVLIDSKR